MTVTGPPGSRKRRHAEALEEVTATRFCSGEVAGYQDPSEDEAALDLLLRERAAALPDSAVSASFLEQKHAYDGSALLQMLRDMPKGAVLHTHSIATGCFHELARRVKASDGKVWAYVGDDRRGFPDFLPRHAFRAQSKSPGADWIRADTLGEDEIYKALTLPAGLGSVEANWGEFFACWDRVNGLVGCSDFYYGEGGFMWHILEEQFRTGVWYLEIKESIFQNVRTLEGDVITDDQWMSLFKDTVDKFKKAHPGFIGARAIMTFLKLLPEVDARQAFRRTVALKEKFPDYIAGYDLAGPEDGAGGMFATMLEEERAKSTLAGELPLMIHAGETNIPQARHVVEAVVMARPGCRIGHGFALARWPGLWPEAKQKGICLEVCPISNQVLGYFPQLAAHPAPTLLRVGIPLIISHDDAGMWHYSDVSYDWAAAVKAWSLNVAELKAMARNSILHSTLPSEEKATFLTAWEAAWRGWVQSSLRGRGR